MSIDLERYAQTYGDLGDKDIQELLSRAAALSRERGRPEVLFLDTNSNRFREQQEHIQSELQRYKEIQYQVVDFFCVHAPVGTKAPPGVLADFNHEIGGVLPNDTPTNYLLLPTSTRRSGQIDPEEYPLLERARAISPHFKIRYNHNIQAVMRIGLLQIGDIRNVLTLPSEVLAARNIGGKTMLFLQQAFSQT